MEMLQYIKDIAACRESLENKPSWLRITTVTMFARQLIPEGFNLKLIKKLLKNKTIGVKPVGSNYVFEWKIKKSKRGRDFYNSVSLGYKDSYSNKAVKLSINGSVHVTGCADIIDCQRVCAQLQVVLRIILARPDLSISFSSFKIVMINTNFWIQSRLNLYSVQRELDALDFDVSYDPGSYVAVKAKFKPFEGSKRITANIFSSGAIIITGAETLKEISAAYKTINESIPTSARIVDSEYMIDGFDIILGATFDEWVNIIDKHV
jgi:TATA-box binding protein (TBP) (component of TFIID and TFIIIB)